MKIFLANPRGFCAGVKRAINIVEKAILLYGAPIYVRHQIVHNTYVVNNLKNKGVIFVENISDVPEKSVLILSAHGVSKKIYQEAKTKNLKILFDATCPLVNKVHMEVIKASKKGTEVILIGHNGHPEIKGTIGQYDNINGGIYLIESINDIFKLKIKNENNLLFVTQTTLSINDCADIIKVLRHRFPKIISSYKKDICYATYNRQIAINTLAKKSDIILVIGSKNSSNAQRLFELAKSKIKISKLIDSEKDIKKIWFKNINYIGITSSASTPEILVKNVLSYLFKIGAKSQVEIDGQKEKINFQLPYKLRIFNSK